MRRDLAKVTHHAADWLLKAAGLGLVLMTVIVGWQVFGRYVLNSSPSWSEQAALTLMIWYVFLFLAADPFLKREHLQKGSITAHSSQTKN